MQSTQLEIQRAESFSIPAIVVLHARDDNFSIVPTLLRGNEGNISEEAGASIDIAFPNWSAGSPDPPLRQLDTLWQVGGNEGHVLAGRLSS